MNISSIILTVDPAQTESVQQALKQFEEVKVEKAAEEKIVLTISSETVDRSTEIWNALERTPGIDSVTMAYCHFDHLLADETQKDVFDAGPMTRREFIRRTAAGVALALVFGSLAGNKSAQAKEAKIPREYKEGSVKWQKGVCRFCGVGCGVMLGVKKGAVVAIQGDKENPVNKGLLCAKGYFSPKILYGQDRLTHPQIRKNGKLVKASWDEALDLVASRFGKLVKENGPDSVAFYLSGQSTIQEGYAALKLVKGGIGTNNLEANARLCMASAVLGFLITFGSDEPMGCYDDLDDGDVFVLWGSNMAEMHPVLFSRIIDRRAKGEKVTLVDIGTRKTRTSHHANLYLEMAPQSDLAIANGIMHILLRDGKWDSEFVKKHVNIKTGKTDIGYGLDYKFKFKDDGKLIDVEGLREFLKDYTPEKVSKISGVSVEKIEQLAALYGDPKTNVVSLWCMGVNQHTRGTWMNNLIFNLHLLTGKICKPGNTPFSLTGQPSACGTVREVGVVTNRLPGPHVVMNAKHREKVAKIWNIPVEKIPQKPTHHAAGMFRAMEHGDIKGMWISTTNPFQTMPNLNRYKEGMKEKKPFIVVSDVYPTETTRHADVVLPAALWVEKEGCFGNSERRTQHFEKMVDPPGDARSDVWQLLELAKKMGYGDLFKFKTDHVERELFEEYRKFTIGTGKDLAPYDVYREERGLRWPVVDGRETKYRYLEGDDPYVKPGTGVQFYKSKTKDNKAVFWARPYEPAAEEPDKEYPFWLCTGRVLEHWHTGSMTRRVPELHQSVPAAYVEIHPKDAAKKGIKTGDRVLVSSRRGDLELRAEVDYGGRALSQQGLIFVPFFDEGKLINLLTLDAMCPISKEPDYKKCAVKIEKV